MGTHCHNELPPSYVSSSNQMLVVMRTDSIISAKGFKAQYTRACGARIIVEDHGFFTPSSDYNLENCTWTLIAANPGNKWTSSYHLRCVHWLALTFVFLPKRLIHLPSNHCSRSHDHKFHTHGDGSVWNWFTYELLWESLFLGVRSGIRGRRHGWSASGQMVRQYHTIADYEYRKLAHRAPVQRERRIAHPFRCSLFRSEYR